MPLGHEILTHQRGWSRRIGSPDALMSAWVHRKVSGTVGQVTAPDRGVTIKESWGLP
jgi:hypothetical protein